MIQKITIILFVTLLSANLFAQQKYSTKKKKAIKHFESAVKYYNQRDDNNAILELQNALNIDNRFVESYNLLAAIYDEQMNYKKEIDNLKKAISINPDFSPNTYYYLGKIEYITGHYTEATKHLNKCLGYQNLKPKFRMWAKNILKRSTFAENAVKHPVDFKPINMGENINTKYDDYWPSLTADEKTLITTVLLPKDDRFPVSYRNSQEDFFISHKVNGKWTKIRNLGKPINTDNNEGAQNFSADGQWLFYTVCNRPEDYGSCDIYFAHKIGKQWTKPKNLGNVVNGGSWDCNPSMSADGRTLYFSSNRRGGKGKKDLWVTRLLDNGTWTKPVNLGDSINTGGNEFAPFIHPDNQTLYFSSDGHIGMGGADIFMSRRKPDGSWGKPVNLGYPINTFKDEIGLIVNTKGNLALFSSDRFGSKSKDIYKFNLYKKARPKPVTYVKGYVYDKNTNKRLKADFEIYNIENDSLVIKSQSNKTDGKYLVCLPLEKNYAFNVSKKGYLFYSDNFSLKNISDDTKYFEMNIPLQPIEKNASIVLKNIFYETNSYELKPESITELKKLLSFLNTNSNISVEISGHTDNVGSKTDNLILSTNRAKTVYQYLIKNGINKNRLKYKGYDFSKPIADNNTKEGRAKNRRTEFKIIDIK